MGAVMIAERLEQATPETWMFPPEEGWTVDQVTDLELPFDWELVDGRVVPSGMTSWWHNRVRRKIESAVEEALVDPYTFDSEQCVTVDERNRPKPDIIVFDDSRLSMDTLVCIPVAKVVLVIEVMSPGSRQDDRVRKPAMYAAAGVPFYWRVEPGEDNVPQVHEYWLHAERGEYIPAPEHPVHTTKLETGHPFPITIDLASLTAR
ncbi:Uma2 family endonuclease [Streptomyces sp. CA-132043]|uniref:Uma2 family endonuclease n=1 Tax=Streptomyces sp. CA-132043 TaxID=3240048 RepID=UPI003D8BED5D